MDLNCEICKFDFRDDYKLKCHFKTSDHLKNQQIFDLLKQNEEFQKKLEQVKLEKEKLKEENKKIEEEYKLKLLNANKKNEKLQYSFDIKYNKMPLIDISTSFSYIEPSLNITKNISCVSNNNFKLNTNFVNNESTL
jgi:predicted nuclease with TOPRIM domain